MFLFIVFKNNGKKYINHYFNKNNNKKNLLISEFKDNNNKYNKKLFMTKNNKVFFMIWNFVLINLINSVLMKRFFFVRIFIIVSFLSFFIKIGN
jgi:hypothetical protein